MKGRVHLIGPLDVLPSLRCRIPSADFIIFEFLVGLVINFKFKFKFYNIPMAPHMHTYGIGN